jgi:glutamate 5-kinase
MSAVVGTDRFINAKRVVIKIGSALLVDEANGTVHRKWLEALADDVARLKQNGQDVILVSSGAIAVGRRYLGLAEGALKLEDKQAAAATGQIRLAHAYQDVLGHHEIIVAQMLVTLDDTENRRRFLNARNTLNAILARGGVPLINENDTVATDEIRFGDNDRLAARIAAMASADVLVLLSDTTPVPDPGKIRMPGTFC